MSFIRISKQLNLIINKMLMTRKRIKIKGKKSKKFMLQLTFIKIQM